MFAAMFRSCDGSIEFFDNISLYILLAPLSYTQLVRGGGRVVGAHIYIGPLPRMGHMGQGTHTLPQSTCNGGIQVERGVDILVIYIEYMYI